MAKNNNLHAAKTAKNDEFYTQLTDIEKELRHYKQHFKNKTVFCNCDDPMESNFWQYFSLNFDRLQLHRLIATHYETDKPSYMLEMWRDEAGVHTDIKKLQQNGDFRSPECIELLKQSDIVVTNPPFSLFREYVAQLMEYDKKFLIIGTLNAVKYKEIFPYFRNNCIWLGNGFQNGNAYFRIPETADTSIYAKGVYDENTKSVKFRNCIWLTNLDISKRHEKIVLWKHYDSTSFPKYDNHNAIDVSKVCDIPVDYDGVMGVPITFFDKYNPDQFEIVGKLSNGIVNGKKVYERVLIRAKRRC